MKQRHRLTCIRGDSMICLIISGLLINYIILRRDIIILTTSDHIPVASDSACHQLEINNITIMTM